jgi:hypothetical protein
MAVMDDRKVSDDTGLWTADLKRWMENLKVGMGSHVYVRVPGGEASLVLAEITADGDLVFEMMAKR